MAGRRRSVRGWASLDDERLLGLRFRDLDVDVRGSALEPLVARCGTSSRSAGSA